MAGKHPSHHLLFPRQILSFSHFCFYLKIRNVYCSTSYKYPNGCGLVMQKINFAMKNKNARIQQTKTVDSSTFHGYIHWYIYYFQLLCESKNVDIFWLLDFPNNTKALLVLYNWLWSIDHLSLWYSVDDALIFSNRRHTQI